MKERPILFSGPMVRAILDDRKTQTRRIVTPQPDYICSDGSPGYDLKRLLDVHKSMRRRMVTKLCPYGQPGDRLWVRESFQPLMADDIPESEWLSCDYKTGNGYKISYPATDGIVEYYNIATDDAFCDRVTPSIHMPRWASRITLEVNGVRVERLQEISEADARCEGVEGQATHGHFREGRRDPYIGYRGTFQTLWDSINAKRSPWSSNPWVWVIEFKRLP